MNELILKKGFYVEITSSENDGDYCTIKKSYCETKEQAKFLLSLAQKFNSKNDRIAGIGNIKDFEETKDCVIEAIRTILEEALNEVKTYFEFNKCDIKLLSKDDILFLIRRICSDELFGYSEWYEFRVFEYGKVFKVNEDVLVEIID